MENKGRLTARRFDRREFMKLAGAAAVAGMAGSVGGCGPTAPPAAAPTVAFTPTAIPRKKRTLKILGQVVTVYDESLKKFTADTGIEIVGKATDEGGVPAEFIAGGGKSFDLAHTAPARLGQIVAHDLAQPVPRELIKHADDILPMWKQRLADPPFNMKDLKGKKEAIDYIYADPSTMKQFMLPPTCGNIEGLGYLPEKFPPEVVKNNRPSYGILYEEPYKGHTSVSIGDIINTQFPAAYLSYRGDMPPLKRGPVNLTQEEIDTVVDFLIKRKRAGQFRVIWESFEQGVELMASKEVWALDAWQPQIFEVKRRGVQWKYGQPLEGIHYWNMSLLVSKYTEAFDECVEYINWWHSGWPGAEVGKLWGYYSAVPKTARTFLGEEMYGFLYEGKPDSKGDYRDGICDKGCGSLEERLTTVNCYWEWPENYDYLAKKYAEFLAAPSG